MHMMEILTTRDQDNLLQLITDTTIAALRLSNAPELTSSKRIKKHQPQRSKLQRLRKN